jgi:hypothetical protein
MAGVAQHTRAVVDPEVADLPDESAYPERAEAQRTVAILLIALHSGGACCRTTCSRIFPMMSGRVTSAMTRNRPPQSGQIDRSIANTRLSLSIQLIGAVGASWSSRQAPCSAGAGACRAVRRRRVRFDELGTTAPRCLALGARMPWYLTRLPRGRGTNAASRARNSIGSNTKWLVPSRYGVFTGYILYPALRAACGCANRLSYRFVSW